MNRKERRAAKKQGAATAGGPPVGALFEQAIGHHRNGRWPQSEALCCAILAREPKHVGSLHLLGVIAQQSGNFGVAADFFRKVIALKPDVAIAHLGLGNALAASGQLQDAIAAFEQSLALKSGSPAPEDAPILLNLGNLYHQVGRAEEAAGCYRRVLALDPDHAEAHNSFGAMLLAQGLRAEASAEFARALKLAPELFETFSGVAATLRRLNPVLDQAVGSMTADTLAVAAQDPMLLCVLESSTLRDVGLEEFFTAARATLLDRAADPTGGDLLLPLACALARQCFINEYVFAESAEEEAQATALCHRIGEALRSKGAVRPLWLAAVASYRPLSALSDAKSLLDRPWPEPIEALLTQQLREVEAEQVLRDSIPRLTAIGEGVSAQVRRQYEENPYPRWVLPPSRRPPVGIDDYLAVQFPAGTFAPLGSRDPLDVLIAGCGTGEHPIGMARRYRGARVYAIDLSLASLAYAARKTRELGLQNIEYAQADLLALESFGRSFDLIDASGVLHHLADPEAGWRALLALLRPRGLMRVGLYSELARADIVAARDFIAERGFDPTAAGIRRCRQELLASPLRAVSRYRDFFSTSECRDLLFHVQERRVTIPQIKRFLAEQNLNFIGFELDGASRQAYRDRNPDDRTMTNLDRWHAFETERPVTFSAMYQFWAQRD
jgi:tetratricopeptide (TPR) repeat protein